MTLKFKKVVQVREIGDNGNHKLKGKEKLVLGIESDTFVK